MSLISSKADLNEKVVLITGALGGIGRETVKTFLREGANVIATDYENTDSITDEISNQNIMTIDCNIVDENDLDKLIKIAIEKFRKIDVLIHCAGIYETTSEDDLTLTSWNRMLEINLTGTFLITNKVFKEMKKYQQGKIITLASNAGQTGGDLAGLHYSASKGGVIAYTKRLAKSAAKHNVYVNSIAPGPIESEMIKDADFNPNHFPLGRIGNPSDVAETALFLSSQSSNFITGQIIGVNGGLVI